MARQYTRKELNLQQIDVNFGTPALPTLHKGLTSNLVKPNLRKNKRKVGSRLSEVQELDACLKGDQVP